MVTGSKKRGEFVNITDKKEFIIQNYNILKRSEIAKKLKMNKIELNLMIIEMNLRKESYKECEMKKAMSELTSQAKQVL
jgi:hypothetical protein